MEFKKIIKTQYGKVIEDFFTCDCFFDIIFDFLIHKKKFSSSYDKFSKEFEKKFPTNGLFLSFIGCSVIICKRSFQYYFTLKNEPFLKRSCIPNLISLDGETTPICVACLIKAVHEEMFFLKHFRLSEEYRDNETCLHLLVSVRTSPTTAL